MLCHIVTRSRQLLLGVHFGSQVLQKCPSPLTTHIPSKSP